MKWIINYHPCPWDEGTCTLAATGGHLDVLKWLRSQDPPCPWGKGTCLEAAEGGHLDVLKWVRSQEPPCPWNEYTCCKAAYGGHLDVLKCPWIGSWTSRAAADGGHLDVLKWVRSQEPPCPWCKDVCIVLPGVDT